MGAHSLRRGKRILSGIVAVGVLWYLGLRSSEQIQHRYNAFSCPGILTPPVNANATATAVASLENLKPNHVQPPDFLVSPFAYVFYATQADYACSVLVNIDRLIHRFNTSHRIIVLVKPDLPSEYLRAFTAQNATVIPYEPPQLATFGSFYYRDVLLKLVTFRLHHYIPSLKRILVLDADQLILQSLDHVFSLPAVDVAAPRAYWQPSGFTSAFLLITLSDRLWNKVSQALRTISPDVFDMDLVNTLFEKTLMVLPGDYTTLNSHWETNDIPLWWQGDEPPLIKQSYPPPLSPYLIGNRTNQTISIDERQKMETERLQEIETINRKANGKRLREALQMVYADTKVLHYTAVGKPWTWQVMAVEQTKPDAHWLLVDQFRTWRTAAKALCPDWDNQEV